jgi:hypothetical protein
MGIGAGAASAIAAGVSAATAIGGTVMSAQSQSNAAKAIAQQNQAMQTAQSQAFTQRMQAQQQQTDAQTAAMQQTMGNRDAAATLMRQNQAAALTRQSDIVNAQNTQAETLRRTGDQAAQDLLSRTAAPVLDASQTGAQVQNAALLSPNLPQGPGPTDPAGDPMVSAASNRRLAEAATNIRDYGSKLGRVASYQQPLADIGQAIAANKVGIMPAQTAEALLRSGNQTRLLPAQVQFRGAGELGQVQDAMIQSRGQGMLDTAALSYGNATNIANLGQADAEMIAKNRAGQAEQDAAYAKQVGGIISGIGQLGLYGAGYKWGGPSWLNPSVTPTVKAA